MIQDNSAMFWKIQKHVLKKYEGFLKHQKESKGIKRNQKESKGIRRNKKE